MTKSRCTGAVLAAILMAAVLISACSDDSPTEPQAIAIQLQHSPENPTAGTFVTFTVDVSGEKPEGVYYEWNFGDGTPIGTSYLGNSNQHQFAEPGIYTVLVRMLKSPDGKLLGEGTTKVQVGSFESSFAMTVSSNGVSVGEEVEYMVQNLGTLIPNPRYTWDFGDGSAAVEVTGDSTITHVYREAGVYTTACSVFDNRTGGKRWAGTVEITVGDVPKPVFANYLRLSLRGSLLYRRVFTKFGELQMDSVIVIDTISTRILDIVNGQGEGLKWDGQHLKGTFSAKTYRLQKHLDVDIELSDDGTSIVALHIQGHTRSEENFDDYRTDTLSLRAFNIPISGQLGTSGATYRLDSGGYPSNISTLSASSQNRKSELFDDRYTCLGIVPGSNGYLEVELYEAW